MTEKADGTLRVKTDPAESMNWGLFISLVSSEVNKDLNTSQGHTETHF